MTVWGADAVEAMSGELRVRRGDVITPLAMERAAERGVRIVVEASAAGHGPSPADGTIAGPGPGSGPEPGGSSGPVPPGPQPGAGPRPVPAGLTTPRPPAVSGALYRRGAPVAPGVSGLAGPGPAAGGPGRVVVVGAGHVGMILAVRLAEADVFDEVALVDVVEGLAAGIALDLTHAAGLSGFRTRVRGATTIEDAGAADYVVITAGRARQPGMSRSDLVATNTEIVGDVAARVAAVSPEAVLVVVTNPLDEMTQHAWQVSGFPAHRVIGMAGVLDTARFQALAALAGAQRADRIDAVALGSHGDEMVIPLSQARVNGRPLAEVIGEAAVTAAVDRARNSGAEVVGLLKKGSAFIAPGTSAARMVLAMARDRGDVMPAAVLADGTYGISGVYIGLPARLGRGGVREIIELPLTAGELSDLRRAADRIRERLGALSSVS